MSSGEQLSPRERNILAHIGRYRLTFKEIIGRLYFDGADPQKALNKLRDAGYIEARKGFGGNRSAYQLQTKAAALLGVSRRRADTLGSDALDIHLAILSFCFLMNRPRILLEKTELAELFGSVLPPGRYHCLEQSTRARRVYHVYVPASTTRPETAVESTREHMLEVLQIPELARWVHYRLYSHAVLAETPGRAEELEKAFDKAVLDGGQALRKLAHIHVECVPGQGTMEEALKSVGA